MKHIKEDSGGTDIICQLPTRHSLGTVNKTMQQQYNAYIPLGQLCSSGTSLHTLCHSSHTQPGKREGREERERGREEGRGGEGGKERDNTSEDVVLRSKSSPPVKHPALQERRSQLERG